MQLKCIILIFPYKLKNEKKMKIFFLLNNIFIKLINFYNYLIECRYMHTKLDTQKE